MKNRNITIIFSHGFGIKKDNLGLFTYLSERFENLGYSTVLFNYNNFNKKTKEVHTISFSKQAKILQTKINEISSNSPETNIVIIGHSQGSIIPTLCDVSKVSKVIGISPFFITDEKEVYARYSAREGSTTDFNSISKRLHSNGETTVIYPEYWKERFNTDQYSLYNSLGSKLPLTLIYGLQDKLVKTATPERVTNGKLIPFDSDHDITGESREQLYEILVKELE